MREGLRVLFVTSAILLTLLACAGGPAPVDDGQEVPAWITSPPEDTSEKVYFVGAGSDSEGSVAEARKKARDGLISSIISFIGVESGPESLPNAEEALAAYRDALERSMTGSRVDPDPDLADGLVIEDTYTERRGSLVSIYLLGAYDKDELLERKSSLRSLFRQEAGAVVSLERKAEQRLEENRPYLAAQLYIEAAAAAVFSESEDQADDYRRNAEKAVEAIERISLERINNNLVGYVRQSFPVPFRVKVADAEASEEGIERVPLVVLYRSTDGSGEMTSERATVVSNEAGIADFMRPAPGFVGSDTITFRLDAEKMVAPLTAIEDLPPKFAPRPKDIRNVALQQRVVFSYSVESRAREIPTAVWTVGFDNGGNALPQSDITMGILEVLKEENFNISSVEMNSKLAKQGDDEIVRRFVSGFGENYERLIYGSARISDFKEESSRYTVKVSGSIRAVDLPSGRVLFDSGEISKSANGQNPQSAISAAFKQLGKHVGTSLIDQLP